MAWIDAALAEQQAGQALVELAEGDFLDQLHQFGDAFREQVKDEIAERRFGQQFVEQRRAAAAPAWSRSR